MSSEQTGITEIIAQKAFHLTNPHSSLVISLWKSRHPILVYVGKRLSDEEVIAIASDDEQIAWPAANSVVGDNADKTWSPARLPNLWPSPNAGDYRSPALLAQIIEGATINTLMDWTYQTHKIYQGRPELFGLVEARVKQSQTLEIVLADPLYPDVKIALSWTVLDSVLLLSSRVENKSNYEMRLSKMASASIDLFPTWQPHLISLTGAWARERILQRQPLNQGRTVFESRRGVSSHTAWPGLILCDALTNLDHGSAFGFSLVWSGDWFLQAEVDEDQGLRIQGGVHEEFLNQRLLPGEVFASPELVFSHSTGGINGLTQVHHDFVNHNLVPPAWQGRSRPVLINNWEATYFDFNRPLLEDIADRASRLGIELFVLDDGWFGERNSEKAGLGDWYANETKLGGTLKDLAQAIKSRGLLFGLWIEPEMVSPDSQLYRKHPDWCLHLAGRNRSESRNQLVLDLSKPDVVDYLIQRLSILLKSAQIDYIKWDMNRPLSHSAYQRVPWVKGLYRLMKTITEAFPQILFEGCAGGGGRMDYASLFFMPQYWTSDNTDAVSRLRIQEGTSLFIPPSVMTAHVSAVPNHQTGRISSLLSRTLVALEGNLGYELDLKLLSPTETTLVKSHIFWYKEWQDVLLFGKRYRLGGSSQGQKANTGIGWVAVDAQKRRAVVAWAQESFIPNQRPAMFTLQGLHQDLWYKVCPVFLDEKQPYYQEIHKYEKKFSGRLLLTRGLPAFVSPGGPSTSMWTLEALEALEALEP